MCKAVNINVKLTRAELPWSNGLVARQNLIFGDTLDRILEESTKNNDVTVD